MPSLFLTLNYTNDPTKSGYVAKMQQKEKATPTAAIKATVGVIH